MGRRSHPKASCLCSSAIPYRNPQTAIYKLLLAEEAISYTSCRLQRDQNSCLRVISAKRSAEPSGYQHHAPPSRLPLDSR